jgi:DNA-binding transcriptional LysR family regulator
VEGGFDLVIRIARLREGSFVARKLAEDRLVACASPAYLGAQGEPRAPEQLVGHNCLRYSVVPLAAEWRFQGPSGSYAVPAGGNFSSTDGSLLREMAIAGLGLAVMPSFMVAKDVAEGRLRLVLEGFRRARLGIHALYASRKQLALRTRLLVDHLARHFARPDWKTA